MWAEQRRPQLSRQRNPSNVERPPCRLLSLAVRQAPLARGLVATDSSTLMRAHMEVARGSRWQDRAREQWRASYTAAETDIALSMGVDTRKLRRRSLEADTANVHVRKQKPVQRMGTAPNQQAP